MTHNCYCLYGPVHWKHEPIRDQRKLFCVYFYFGPDDDAGYGLYPESGEYWFCTRVEAERFRKLIEVFLLDIIDSGTHRLDERMAECSEHWQWDVWRKLPIV